MKNIPLPKPQGLVINETQAERWGHTESRFQQPHLKNRSERIEQQEHKSDSSSKDGENK